MLKRESKHSARLRELGFVHIPEELAASQREKMEHTLKSLSRSARRQARKILDRGGYHWSPIDGNTYLTDEVGQDWAASTKIDLFKECGFPDLMEEAGPLLGLVSPTRKTKH